MASFDFDLIVLGGGSGGVRAARMAASFGARVAVVEEKDLGGTCVNVGCVPKKLFAYGAHFGDDLHDMASYGWRVGEVSFDWATLRDNKDKEIRRLNGVYERLLDDTGVEIVRGRGVVCGAHGVRVEGRELSGQNLLIATGGQPSRPTEEEMPGVSLTWTSDEMFHLDELPDRIVIVGGGYIGCEFASILRGLGREVHLVTRADALLRGFDGDVRHELGNELRKRGIHLQLSCSPRRVDQLDDGSLRFEGLEGSVIDADAVLMATGRQPNTAGLGLEEHGVQLSERGAVVVNDRYQSTVPSIYAVGDVIDRLQLTPVALAEGTLVARNLFLHEDREVDYRFTPTAVFTHPSVGTVGWTEEEARHHGVSVRLYKSLFRPLRHTMTGGAERTFMKLVVDDDTDRVLGLHMVGPDAAEITQGFAVALQCGATKAQLDATIGVHPSAAEEFVTMRTPWVPAPSSGHEGG